MSSIVKRPESIRVFLFALLASAAQTLNAASLDIAEQPLFLSGNTDPNIMFLQDDSGSMQYENMSSTLPLADYNFPRASGVYGSGDYANVVLDFGTDSIGFVQRNFLFNTIYYDPEKTYSPWVDAAGNSWPDADPECAPHNPATHRPGSTSCPSNDSQVSRDLTRVNAQTAIWIRSEIINCDDYSGDQQGAFFGSANGDTLLGCHRFVSNEKGYRLYAEQARDNFWPATYYRYDDGGSGNFLSAFLNRDNHERIELCRAGDGAIENNCLDGAQMQNYANWYTYYRSRILTARAGIGRAFSQLGDNVRVGFGGINVDDTIVNGVNPYAGQGRVNFFETLYNHPIPVASTPLRRALNTVGQYYQDGSDGGPWAETVDGAPEIAECRQSYTILMSDGFWNGPDPANISPGNVDNSAGPTIQGPDQEPYRYQPAPPYADGHENTLADVAMYYWNRDLLPDVANRVTPNSKDEAFWQHMTTFTVGLGVNGSLDNPGDRSALDSGNLNWPEPQANTNRTIDDMWHAGINGRGEFFSATDPDEFAQSLGAILRDIESREGSAASVSVSTGTISSASRVYQATFVSGEWSGHVNSLPISDGSGNATCGSSTPLGALCPVEWDAACMLTGGACAATGNIESTPNFRTGRSIITFDPDTRDGAPFQSDGENAGLTPAQLDYLRGDRSNEGAAPGEFRVRDNLLGDIAHSSPVLVGDPDRIGYPAQWSDLRHNGANAPETNYFAFRNNNLSRSKLVFVGANDGMLHAFDAATGRERFAYIPGLIADKLPDLLEQNYIHRYYVDATPNVTDAFIDGQWRTVMVGGLGAGGQGLYALDITGDAGDSNYFSEANAQNIVLWEFGDRDNAETTVNEGDVDLGFSFSQPQIVRMHNGKWSALFGNGYDNTEADGSVSTSGNAVLYILDLANGDVLQKLDTGIGAAQDPTGQGRPNGLSTVTPVDLDGDLIVDYVYAGDLFGNLWQFDLTAQNPNAWRVGIRENGTAKPLFTATDAAGAAQSITSAPQVALHPLGPDHGIVVYFGTGKYFEFGDEEVTTSLTHSIYGVRDSNVFSFDPLTDFEPSPAHGVTRSQLQQQEIFQQVSDSGFTFRLITDAPTGSAGLDWQRAGVPNGVHGFYLDLKQRGQTTEGERVVSDPVLRRGVLTFSTLIPNNDSCSGGTSGFFYAIDAATGGRFEEPVFDLNDDFMFTDADRLNSGSDADGDGENDRVPASARRIRGGAGSSPGFAIGNGTNFFYIGTTQAQVDSGILNIGGPPEGRRSWRELRR